MYKILKARLSALKRVLLSRVHDQNDRRRRKMIDLMQEMWDSCSEDNDVWNLRWNFKHIICGVGKFSTWCRGIYICMQPVYKHWAYLCSWRPFVPVPLQWTQSIGMQTERFKGIVPGNKTNIFMSYMWKY
jgi:hypothetical protein